MAARSMPLGRAWHVLTCEETAAACSFVDSKKYRFFPPSPTSANRERMYGCECSREYSAGISRSDILLDRLGSRNRNLDSHFTGNKVTTFAFLNRNLWSVRNGTCLLLTEASTSGTAVPSDVTTENKVTEKLIPENKKKNPFVYQIEDLDAIQLQEGGTSREDCLLTVVKSSMALARPPISRFHVAAVGIASSGSAYVGVNLEFPGLPLHHSVHAEQFMVANASQHGETLIQNLFVSHAPCGHCRQFLSELRNAGDLRIRIVSSDDERPLSEFLPHRFGPHDLLDDDFPLLMERNHNRLKLSRKVSNGGSFVSTKSAITDSAKDHDALVTSALEAANDSYSPYSDSPSGVALRTSSGKVYKGSYMECAAYNPSLPPLQAAIIALVAQGDEVYTDIVEVVLVEKEGAAIQFASTVKIVVEKIAPAASLVVYEVERVREGEGEGEGEGERGRK